MSDTDLQLLARYARDRAEDAFAEIVRRHLDLVHSAALRQVRSPQLAEEVSQSVFIDLARNWDHLAPNTILTAWLYQVTRRTAIDVVRREARRHLREQIATEMNALNATAADWTHIEPLLDEAMHALDDTDRAAVLLRYFENKSLREVGATLGTSDDAAQKRVSRAVEQLREFFAKRGITVGVGGLVVAISTNAVQAAPAELAVTIATAASVAGTTLATAAAGAAKAIALTSLQKSLIAAIVAAVVGAVVYEVWQTSPQQAQNRSVRQQAPVTPQTIAQRFVEISAEIQLIDYVQQTNRAGIQPRVRRSYPVKCIVGTTEWSLESWFSDSMTENWYFDGTNVYESFLVTKFSPNVSAAPPTPLVMGPITPEFARSNITIRIIPSAGGYPMGNLGVQVPWLAFCSGSYLKRDGRVVPLPTVPGRIAADPFAYTDKTQVFNDEFGVPTMLWLLTSKEQYQRGIRDERTAKTGAAQRARLNPVLPAYPDGVLKFRYEVTASTNFAGWNFPTTFTYTEYEPDRDGRWNPHLGGVGRLVSIRESLSRPRNVWDPGKRQMVMDFRFRHPGKIVDGIIYPWTKDVVPSMDDPELQAEFSKVVGRAEDDPVARTRVVP